MLKKIEGRYWIREQMMNFIKEADRMIKEYRWQDRTVAPYGHAEPITKVMGWLKDYDICTEGTKETLVLIANGLADILNAWEEHEKSRTVKVKLLRGKHKGEERMLDPWMAEMLVEDGAIEII